MAEAGKFLLNLPIKRSSETPTCFVIVYIDISDNFYIFQQNSSHSTGLWDDCGTFFILS